MNAIKISKCAILPSFSRTNACHVSSDGSSHCLPTVDCLFMLLISRNDMRRLILPTPDFKPAFSSLMILCVLGRSFGRLGITAPALRVRSAKNESLSEANFRNAFSKSTSFSAPVPLTGVALIVVLLLLLSVPFLSGVGENDEIDNRASSESRDRRWYEFRLAFRAVESRFDGRSSTSASLSSSMVCSTGAWGVLLLANSSSFPHRSCWLSMPSEVLARPAR